MRYKQGYGKSTAVVHAVPTRHQKTAPFTRRERRTQPTMGPKYWHGESVVRAMLRVEQLDDDRKCETKRVDAQWSRARSEDAVSMCHTREYKQHHRNQAVQANPWLVSYHPKAYFTGAR